MAVPAAGPRPDRPHTMDDFNRMFPPPRLQDGHPTQPKKRPQLPCSEPIPKSIYKAAQNPSKAWANLIKCSG